MYRHQRHNCTVSTQPLSSNGDEFCSHLPEELTVEILLRLPVRYLHQFKCICKSWKTLISDSRFVKRHLQISTAEPCLTQQLLFFSRLGGSYELLYYPLKPLFQNLLPPVNSSGMMKHPYWIIGSCNGLLCLYDRFKHYVRLHNPSITFKSKKSPKAVSIDWVNRQCGFGYDKVNDKYKVLVVVRNKNDSSQSLTKIYTFGEDSWKTIPNFPYNPVVLLGKFVSGTLNWIVVKRGVTSNQSVIFSFDLEKETYKEMLMPQDDGDKVYEHTLYVLKNCIGVCYLSNQTHWIACLMKEYGVVESWTKFIIIPLEKLDKLFRKEYFFIIPLFILENGVVLLVDKYTSQFILYNLNNGQLDYSVISIDVLHNEHICFESLVSLPWLHEALEKLPETNDFVKVGVPLVLLTIMYSLKALNLLS